MMTGRYNEPKLHYFWEDGKKGDEVCDFYIKQIEISKGLSENFVIHLNGPQEYNLSEVGLNRIRKMLEVCDKCNINLCVENLYSEEEIPYIFKNINHNRLKICYDVGHKNFLTPNFDIMARYSEYISVLHLHDNNGTKDEHLPCGRGNIDWKKFAQEELITIPNITLSAEVREVGNNILQETFEGLEMIEKFVRS